MEFIKIVLFLFVVNKNLLKKKEQNLIFFSCGSINLLGKTALWNFISKRINGTPKRIYCKRNLQVRCFKLSMQYKRAFKKKKDFVRVRFNDSWFIFHNSSWSFHKPEFSRKHISRIIWSEQNTRLWPSKLKINTELCGKDIILKTLLSTISSMIHFFIKQKFCKYQFLYSQK